MKLVVKLSLGLLISFTIITKHMEIEEEKPEVPVIVENSTSVMSGSVQIIGYEFGMAM